MEHQPVTEIIGLFGREHFAELRFHFGRVFGAVRQAQLAGNADTVGIRHHNARLMIDVAQDQIGGLSPHAGELQKIIHVVRHLSAVFIQYHPGGAHNIAGLGPEEACGMDVGLQFTDVGFGQRLQGGETGKESGRHHIYTLVGALGRQTDGKEQFIGFGIVQGADPVRVELFQLRYDGENIRFCFHSDSPRLSEI